MNGGGEALHPVDFALFVLDGEACPALLHGEPHRAAAQELGAELGFQLEELGGRVVGFSRVHRRGPQYRRAIGAGTRQVVVHSPALVAPRCNGSHVPVVVDRVDIVATGDPGESEAVAGQPFVEETRPAGVLAGRFAGDPGIEHGPVQLRQQPVEKF